MKVKQKGYLLVQKTVKQKHVHTKVKQNRFRQGRVVGVGSLEVHPAADGGHQGAARADRGLR